MSYTLYFNENLLKFGHLVFGILANRQTDRETHRHAMRRTHTRDDVKKHKTSRQTHIGTHQTIALAFSA